MLNKVFTLIDTYRGNPVHGNRKINNFNISSVLKPSDSCWLHLLTQSDTAINNKRKIWPKEKGLKF